jgi:hypothetical protein
VYVPMILVRFCPDVRSGGERKRAQQGGTYRQLRSTVRPNTKTRQTTPSSRCGLIDARGGGLDATGLLDPRNGITRLLLVDESNETRFTSEQAVKRRTNRHARSGLNRVMSLAHILL